MNINIDGKSVGARILLALVVLSGIVEMLSNNWAPVATPMTYELCLEVCGSQESKIHKMDAWSCECATGSKKDES